MSAGQGVLFGERTRCGYCNRELVAAGEIDGATCYECPRCAPILPTVVDAQDFARFQRIAWKERV